MTCFDFFYEWTVVPKVCRIEKSVGERVLAMISVSCYRIKGVGGYEGENGGKGEREGRGEGKGEGRVKDGAKGRGRRGLGQG